MQELIITAFLVPFKVLHIHHSSTLLNHTRSWFYLRYLTLHWKELQERLRFGDRSEKLRNSHFLVTLTRITEAHLDVPLDSSYHDRTAPRTSAVLCHALQKHTNNQRKTKYPTVI